MVLLLAVPRSQRRRSLPDVARAPDSSPSVTAPAGVSTSTGQRPWSGVPADSEVAARVDQAGALLCEQVASPVDGVALGDPAEVEPDACSELDPRGGPVDDDPAAARPAGLAVDGCVRIEVGKRAVVAGRDDGVVHGGVEASSSSLAGLERELGHLE